MAGEADAGMPDAVALAATPMISARVQWSGSGSPAVVRRTSEAGRAASIAAGRGVRGTAGFTACEQHCFLGGMRD